MYTTELKKPSPDKTEAVFRKVDELKREKAKGKIILYFDGTGCIARAEVQKDI